MKNYCIREDYIANNENRTLESEGNVFWNKERIYYSSLYQWHVYRYGLEIIKRNHIKNVLDIGCGTASKLVKMISPAANIYGIDQPTAIEYCKANYKVGTFYADNLEDPKVCIDVPFGLVICSDVIEHIVNPDIVINYIKKFCSKETYILFSTPDRERLRGKDCLYSPKKEHIREWNAEEFRSYLGESGFLVLEQKHIPPVRTMLNGLFLKHFVARIKTLMPYRYNQFVLCKLIM